MSGLSPSMRVIHSFRAQNKVERVSPLDPGISRGVTDLYPSPGYTHPVTRAIEVSHSHPACKAEFWPNSFFGRSHCWSVYVHFLTSIIVFNPWAAGVSATTHSSQTRPAPSTRRWWCATPRSPSRFEAMQVNAESEPVFKKFSGILIIWVLFLPDNFW